MITEVAAISVDAARSDAFEAAVAGVAHLFRDASGCRGMTLERECEDPANYLLLVQWDSVEAHTQDFRSSSSFAAWRAAVAPFVMRPPSAVHTRNIATYF